MHICQFCSKSFKASQGLHSHITQNAKCRARFDAKVHESTTGLDPQSSTLDDWDGGIPNYDTEAFPPAQCDDDEDPMDMDPPPSIPSSEPQLNPLHTGPIRWCHQFPMEAGTAYGTCKPSFRRIHDERGDNHQPPWFPFPSLESWLLARWLVTSGVSQTKMNEFLDLRMVQENLKPGFRNARGMMQNIDTLPKATSWNCKAYEVTGDVTNGDGELIKEEIEVWMRDPLECIRDLLEDPVIGKENVYAPCRQFRDEACTNREYGEMWTAGWWWETQKKLPEGATIAPVILSSDKTKLTNFSGDKQAYPVYLGLGNTPKDTRRKSSNRAMVLIGYIPVLKLECFSPSRRSLEGYQIFHNCMEAILEPLVQAGKEGVMMNCADGKTRKVFPIVAAYLADYPEQCLVVGCKESTCPTCTVMPEKRGEPVHSVLRDPDETLRVLGERSNGFRPPEFNQWSLRPTRPFWRHLPHCNIFACITPDILHQLHKGVFKDHVVSWSTQAMEGGEEEIDRRFKSMTHHVSLRHFKNGISVTTQWTGTEHKNMEKVYLGILANATDPAVIRVTRAALDFIYYAQFEVHTDDSLVQLDRAWVDFHANKQVFVDLGIRQHFNISKIHNIKHYVDLIRSLGSAMGYNTEATERLHIDSAKVGYRASNKKEYLAQMTTWLARQEAVHKFSAYLDWAMPGLKPTCSELKAAGKLEVEGGSDRAEALEGEEEEEDGDEDEAEFVGGSTESRVTWRIAKEPAYGRLDVTSIKRDFGAISFEAHLTKYLRDKYPSTAVSILPTSSFPVYRRLYLKLPVIHEVSAQRLEDVVLANREKPRTITPRGIKKGTPSRFTTVLVRTHPVNHGKGPHDGLAVAQVRVIFRITNNADEEPLLYVHWFKPLREPVANLEMYQVSFSSHQHQHRASIIPASKLVASCHLIPNFGKAINAAWTADNILEQAPTFYLNLYLRYWDFYVLRYLHERHKFANRPQREVMRTRILAQAPIHYG